ncbi:DUP/COS family protein SPAR_A00750 [Saccharomyces paradoxus]|uniref:DUP/COS family protein n=1 Tax=Saccharomyces paradoxus TaxID=27291 RepID=A0A8B8UL38_SACPA|nr:uncharacterized protein SPAR_A00750 [Saccharomyces paradoxus]QHS71451.1 hypothetical protein SPAR_A00750 [Saccharomyces paradoxus]
MQSLPEDTFSSYWSYLLYELAHYKPTLILFLIVVSLLSLIVLYRNNEVCVGVSVVLILLCFCSSGVIIGEGFEKPITHEDFETNLSVEVIVRKPAGKEWGTVAYNMNQYLFNERLWNTPYYFYSGRECRDFFRTITKNVPKNTGPILKEYMSKAVQIEKEAQREYWRKQYPKADLL